jgi:hypothetical protein
MPNEFENFPFHDFWNQQIRESIHDVARRLTNSEHDEQKEHFKRGYGEGYSHPPGSGEALFSRVYDDQGRFLGVLSIKDIDHVSVTPVQV